MDMALEQVKETLNKVCDNTKAVCDCGDDYFCDCKNCITGVLKEMVEAREYYKWHYLSDNPDDLPELLTTVLIEASYEGMDPIYDTDWRNDKGQWVMAGPNTKIIRWKYIEP